jgi:hypothetical protein
MTKDVDTPSYEDIGISDWFWDILHRAEHSGEKLREILMKLEKSQVSRFQNEYEAAAIVLADYPYTEYLDDLTRKSEDEIFDLTLWVVSQGKQYYIQVLDHPELMPPDLEGRENPFEGVAVDVEYEK